RVGDRVIINDSITNYIFFFKRKTAYEIGVTALQMDIKIAGITEAIMDQALRQAREGRMHILNEMAKGLSGARPELRESAPRINVIHIPQDKIGTVIGPGGKMIREICETTGTKIDIEDDGTV